jgi:hypothetical protein
MKKFYKKLILATFPVTPNEVPAESLRLRG